jgi:hypothetical protein
MRRPDEVADFSAPLGLGLARLGGSGAWFQGCSSLSAPWISVTLRVGCLSMGMEDSLQSESLVGSRPAQIAVKITAGSGPLASTLSS